MTAALLVSALFAAPAVQEAVKRAQPTLFLPTNPGFRALGGKEAATYQLVSAWLEERMREAEAIKPGMTYADLTRTFRADGGISTPTKHRFVSILCPYLKINVEFEGDARHPLGQAATVRKVSKPYFEREFGD